MKNPIDLLKKINIIVIDDMDSMLGLIISCLRELGAEKIQTASNGELAWKMLNKNRYDLIICDWDMPKMTGYQLLKLVRESQLHQHIPFLLLTAATEKKLVLDAVQAGVSDYLAKPFQPKELDYRIIKLLRKVDLNPAALSNRE
ncbi:MULTISPECIES: response regulator [Alteromonadaceae]|uniref:Response regulator n=1 Tax=Brumicola blandensis TaxID=3075611 RepID=A0AAW8R2S9_9ALTE|nr:MULTISPECIES: response regulator [unclassified Alteromonas]MDT0582165.1 response regulator [Alteromonas sp. W409]MDT0627879.1 response regulator [Alteromonas sp. W364]